MTRVRSALLVGLLATSAAPGTALGASWGRPVEKGRVERTELTGTPASGPIHDRLLKGPRARSASGPSRVEEYVDEHGHSILIGTSIDGLDLRPFAALLAGTVHGRELSDLRVLVVPASQVGAECGGGFEVVACYGADDPGRLRSGLMIVPDHDPDLVHAVVHEYGHHVDAQLANLSHLGLCSFDNDGSRRWYFARDTQSDVSDRAGCTDNVPYGRLLGELYAEDYVALNGIRDWGTVDFAPPSRRVLAELRTDIFHRFRPQLRRYDSRLGAWRTTTRRYVLSAPTFFRARLVGPRRANLDLLLHRKGHRRPSARSAHPGSRERITRLLGRGTWYLKVRAHRFGGGYRLRVGLY